MEVPAWAFLCLFSLKNFIMLVWPSIWHSYITFYVLYRLLLNIHILYFLKIIWAWGFNYWKIWVKFNEKKSGFKYMLIFKRVNRNRIGGIKNGLSCFWVLLELICCCLSSYKVELFLSMNLFSLASIFQSVGEI